MTTTRDIWQDNFKTSFMSRYINEIHYDWLWLCCCCCSTAVWSARRVICVFGNPEFLRSCSMETDKPEDRCPIRAAQNTAALRHDVHFKSSQLCVRQVKEMGL